MEDEHPNKPDVDAEPRRVSQSLILALTGLHTMVEGFYELSGRFIGG